MFQSQLTQGSQTTCPYATRLRGRWSTGPCHPSSCRSWRSSAFARLNFAIFSAHAFFVQIEAARGTNAHPRRQKYLRTLVLISARDTSAVRRARVGLTDPVEVKHAGSPTLVVSRLPCTIGVKVPRMHLALAGQPPASIISKKARTR